MKNTTAIKKYGVVNIGRYTELPREKTPAESDYRSGDYNRYGSDNLFPNLSAEIIDRCSHLGGTIGSKVTFICGHGITNDIIINTDNETKTDVFRKIAKDYESFSNAYLEVVTGNSNVLKGMINIYHRDSTTVRRGKNKYEGQYILCDDWSQMRGQISFDRYYMTAIARYPDYTVIDGNRHSIIHISDYHPRYKYYGLIEWVSGLAASEIAYKTDKWNISKLDNNYVPSGILTVGVGSQSEADELREYYEKEEIGVGRNGKVMFIAVGNEGATTTFTPMNQNVEGSWMTLKEATKEDILAACNWFGILLGQSKPGALGQTQEIRNVYNLAMKTIIRPKRQKILTMFDNIFNMQHEIQDLIPFDYGDKIDFNLLLTRRQAFEMLGLSYDEKRTDLDETIKKPGQVKTSNNSNPL
jgi:phage portal protein BeeE